MGDDSDRRSAAVAYEYLGPEPEFVTISAFGHLFEDYPSGLAEDLITLEKEGAIYSHFALPGTERGDGSAEFGYYRIPFLPKEIFEYVEASLAFHQYQQARDAGASFDEALAALDNPEIADRVRRWGNYGKMKLKNGMVYDGRGCHASFYPPGMEALVCGARRDRYESLPELPAARDRLALVMQVLNNFSIAARILGKRQRNASPFEIVDEYDVQDLLFTVLRTVFEDARREEWTPQIAGSAKRMDILIPSLDTVVEAKLVRDAKHAKSVGDELRVDFEAYHSHPNCKQLIAFVYDPHRHIPDAAQFGNELSGLRQKGDHSFEVTVLVR